jgi:hypothetical protein
MAARKETQVPEETTLPADSQACRFGKPMRSVALTLRSSVV